MTNKIDISERERDLAAIMFKLNPLGDPDLSETEKSKLRYEYVCVLSKHKMLYHFDESVADIAWDCEPPNDAEAEMLDSLTNNLYSEELFDIANDTVDSLNNIGERS